MLHFEYSITSLCYIHPFPPILLLLQLSLSFQIPPEGYRRVIIS